MCGWGLGFTKVKGKYLYLSLFTGNGNLSIFVVLDRRASLLDQRAIASGCEEGWNTSTPCPDSLC